MKTLYTAEQVRAIERECLAPFAEGELILRAGRALARQADRMCWSMTPPVAIHAFHGPGNNGADALAATQNLREMGYRVHTHSLSQLLSACADDEKTGQFAASFSDNTLIIDGLFGIGLSRPPDARLQVLFRALNAGAARVLAVDVPSGFDAETGQPAGTCLRAHVTVTMLVDKTGLHSGEASAWCGEVVVDELDCTGIIHAPDAFAARLPFSQRVELLELADLRRHLPRRSGIAHKGTQGSVLVIGGASGMKGAAILAAQGAQAGGAGKVFVHLSGSDGASDAMAMTHPSLLDFSGPRQWNEVIAAFDAVLIGCGMGQSESALSDLNAVLAACVRLDKPLVLDADALNALASGKVRISEHRHRRSALPWVITPHPLEAARLLGKPTGNIQSQRFAAACDLVRKYGVTALLKGPGSVIAGPLAADAGSPTLGETDPSPVRLAVAPAGSPALAVGGSGDTLAGLVLGLLGQGLDSFDAAALAASVHAQAAAQWTALHPRSQGLRAEDLPALIVEWMNLEH